jgi:hypothetical protein
MVLAVCFNPVRNKYKYQQNIPSNFGLPESSHLVADQIEADALFSGNHDNGLAEARRYPSIWDMGYSSPLMLGIRSSTIANDT